METTRREILLSELKKLWDEIGEPETERDRMIFEAEQICMQLYKKKVDQVRQNCAQLRKAVAESESELAFICAALGERSVLIRLNSGGLKRELQVVRSQLEEIRRKKKDRMKLFMDVLEQINCILKELYAGNQFMPIIDESDLSLKRLGGLKVQLHGFESKKNNRVKQVADDLNTLDSLCSVLGLDLNLTVTEIHPTLGDSSGSRSISLETIEKLSTTISGLKDIKTKRMQKLLSLADTMIELQRFMDTPADEQGRFHKVTRNIAASEDESSEPNSLSLDFIQCVEDEVSRLQEMKSSKMKEVLLKKRVQLEKLCKKAHLVDYDVETIESGPADPSFLLEQIELQISQVEEEAFSRKEMLGKIEKWLAACEEESWLEEYSRCAKRGAHMLLKRAEKARVLVNKIPAMVEALASKAESWEKQRGAYFLFDGEDKKQERLRERDLKRLQAQMLLEQEALFGSKPSPAKSGRKNSHPDIVTPSSNTQNKSGNYLKQQNSRRKVYLYPRERDISGIKSKKPCIPKSSEPMLIRKPLSPVSSSSFLCTSNPRNVQTERKKKHSINKAPPTPRTLGWDDENETPMKLPIPVPITPTTVSAGPPSCRLHLTTFLLQDKRSALLKRGAAFQVF